MFHREYRETWKPEYVVREAKRECIGRCMLICTFISSKGRGKDVMIHRVIIALYSFFTPLIHTIAHLVLIITYDGESEAHFSTA